MYTNWYLKKEGISIYHDGNQILNKIEKSEEYPRITTQIPIKENLLPDYKLKPYAVEYDRIHDQFKFKICEGFYEDNKGKLTYYYALRKNSEPGDDLGKIPTGCRVEFDPRSWSIKLTGKKAYPDGWIKIDKKYKKKKGRKSVFTIKKQVEEPEQLMEVPEVAIGISSDGELVCLPNSGDPIRIGGCGEPGTGKSMILHRLKDQWSEKVDDYLVVEFNDRKTETGEYAYPWPETHKFSTQLAKINEIPKAHKMVYLHPVDHNLIKEDGSWREEYMLHPGVLGFPVYIPFKNMILDTKSFQIVYDMGKSASYLQQAIYDPITTRIDEDGLISAKNMEEISEKIWGCKEIPKNSKSKIVNQCMEWYRSRFWDISNNADPIWSLKRKGGTIKQYPWNISLMAGLSITFVTKHVIHEPYYPIMLKFFIDNVFNTKRDSEQLRDKTLMFFVDEAPDITKNVKTKPILYEALRAMRSEGIGGCIFSQYYEDIPQDMRNNMSHYVIFKTTAKDNLSKERLPHDKEMFKRVNKLEKFECIITGDLVLYRKGKKYSNEGRPIRMMCLPPNSMHQAPPGFKAA